MHAICWNVQSKTYQHRQVFTTQFDVIPLGSQTSSAMDSDLWVSTAKVTMLCSGMCELSCSLLDTYHT